MWVKCQQSMKVCGKERLSGTVFKDHSEPRHQDMMQSHPYCKAELSLDLSNYQTTHSFYLPVSSILKEFLGVIQHAGHGQSGEQGPGVNWGAAQTNGVNTANGCNTDTNFALNEIIHFAVLEYLSEHELWQGCWWSTYNCFKHGLKAFWFLSCSDQLSHEVSWLMPQPVAN